MRKQGRGGKNNPGGGGKTPYSKVTKGEKGAQERKRSAHEPNYIDRQRVEKQKDLRCVKIH